MSWLGSKSRSALAVVSVAVLAGCAGGGSGPLPVAQQQAVAYRHDGPPSITLITMINNRTGKGGHAALLVNASQRVLFDPAGSFRVDWLTEQGDVLYGMTERNFTAYKSAHSRGTHHVVTQEVIVPAAVAERALQLVEARGSVSSAFCANATSDILRQLPGFQDIDVTFYPHRLMEQFASRPGVTTDKRFENDEGDIMDGIAAVNASRQRQQ